MPLRVADVVAVLDALDIEQAHVVGLSWGGRLAFGIGEQAPERVRSLVIVGQQPYAIDPDGPLVRVVSDALEASREQGIEALVQAFEAVVGRYPEPMRAAYLACDAAAMRAAFAAAMSEGAVSERLGEWRVPCLICVAADDVDFFEQARPCHGDPGRGVRLDRRNGPPGHGHRLCGTRLGRDPEDPASNKLRDPPGARLVSGAPTSCGSRLGERESECRRPSMDVHLHERSQRSDPRGARRDKIVSDLREHAHEGQDSPLLADVAAAGLALVVLPILGLLLRRPHPGWKFWMLLPAILVSLFSLVVAGSSAC